MPRNQGDTDKVQKEVEAYEISLVNPAETRFVEASPEAPRTSPIVGSIFLPSNRL